MATAQAQLTPTTDNTPATVSVPAKELSGAQWVNRFPGSKSIDACVDPFKTNLQNFVDALKDAGANVNISATYRPPERAYLMHWCWLIAKGKADPQKIPEKDGVPIRWDHVDEKGTYAKDKSISAAKDMVNGYGMQRLGVAPALVSEHTKKLAVDMNISWDGVLTIDGKDGKAVEIKSSPRTGMNADLHKIGAGYGVIKFNAGGDDKPHWSSTGS